MTRWDEWSLQFVVQDNNSLCNSTFASKSESTFCGTTLIDSALGENSGCGMCDFGGLRHPAMTRRTGAIPGTGAGCASYRQNSPDDCRRQPILSTRVSLRVHGGDLAIAQGPHEIDAGGFVKIVTLGCLGVLFGQHYRY